MRFVWLLTAAALVGLDRLTKFLVSSNMELSDTIHILKAGDTEILNIYYCVNSGAAFSRFQGKKVLLIVVTSVVILWLLYMIIFKKINRPIYCAAASLMLGGGIGNLIDRIFNNGMVIDFIDFRLINFPIFNVADICAVCGAALLFISLLVDEIRQKKNKKASPNSGKKNDGEV